ncbi:MAG: hypothetical protein MI674_00370, partial [Cytophagales bacterium]|nr:hypothetical protein [Cytophagales bacterium]
MISSARQSAAPSNNSSEGQKINSGKSTTPLVSVNDQTPASGKEQYLVVRIKAQRGRRERGNRNDIHNNEGVSDGQQALPGYQKGAMESAQ